MEVGKANYGGNRRDFKIEDGDNVYRILPPLGTAAQKGIWNVYIALEWGYKGTDGRHKPFQDCRKVNFKTKMVEVESPAFLHRQKLEENKKSVVEAFKANQATEDQVKEAVALTRQYNLNKKYYLNVVNLKGEIGRLPIGYKAMQGVKACIEALGKKGVDPLSVDNGRFFNIFRSGTGLDTMYQVTIYQENIMATINGTQQEVAQEKVHVMDDAFIGRLGSEACDLLNFKAGYPLLEPEEIQQMLDGGASAVDAVFAKYKKEEPKAKAQPAQQAAPKAEVAIEQRAEAVAPAAEHVIKAEEPTPTQAQVDQAAAIAPTEPAQETSANTESIDDFLKNLKVG